MKLYNSEPIPEDLPTNISPEEASMVSGIKVATIKQRLRAGWSKEEAYWRKVRFNKRNPANFNEAIHEKTGDERNTQLEYEYLVRMKN
jgi:hypothetical protein